MTELRIILDHSTQDHQLPTPESASEAGIWLARRGHYASAAAFLALAQALEVDNYAATVATAADGLVRVPILGTTRDEQPRMPEPLSHSAHDPVARASCILCGEIIWAYGWRRDQVEVTPHPGADPEFMAGRAEFSEWQHVAGADRAPSWLPHDATPTGGSVVAGPLPDERGVGGR